MCVKRQEKIINISGMCVKTFARKMCLYEGNIAVIRVTGFGLLLQGPFAHKLFN